MKTMSVSLVCLALCCADGVAAEKEPEYSALDPRGTWPTVARIPLAKRLPTLKGKRIHLILSWDQESGFDQTVQDLAAAVTAAGAKATIVKRNLRYSEDDPALWAQMKKEKADGFLYLAAASSSTTSYAFKWSAHLEKSGSSHTGARWARSTSVPAKHAAATYHQCSGLHRTSAQTTTAARTSSGNPTSRPLRRSTHHRLVA